MGLIDEYIARIPEPALDRVITADKWCKGETVGDDGARCLIGHGDDWVSVSSYQTAPLDGEATAVRNAIDHPAKRYIWRTVAFTFDRTARRFGLERAVQLVKARAGRRTHVNTDSLKGAFQEVGQ